MDLQNIISAIEKTDPEIYQRLDTRRKAMKSFANVGRTIAMAAVPLVLSGMFKKAYGRTPATVIDVLNFALLLERLESGFYSEAVTHTSLFPTNAALTSFQTIAGHESAHVNLLKSTITALSGTPDLSHTFDYTAGGTFDTFTNYQTLLAVAQAFEDTGVRAYKGQAGNLQENKTVLTVALQIHSVEARHAAHIRLMRGQKAWITGNVTDVAAIQKTYNGEELAVQAGVTITGISAEVTADAATQSFDEPLTKAQVTEIVTPFLAS